MRCTFSDKKALKAVFRRSFVSGAGSVLSLQGRRIIVPKTQKSMPGPGHDAEEIRDDWRRVGKQLVWASKAVKK